MPRTLTVLLVLAWLGAGTGACGQEYWPGVGESTFTFNSPYFGSVDFTLAHYGLNSTLTFANRVEGAHTTIDFAHDAEGSLCLVRKAVNFHTDSTEYIPDRPIVLLPSDFEIGDSWTHAGTCAIRDYRGPDEVFAFIARVTVVAFESLTVPAGTFETVRLNLENVWPDNLNGSVYLHRQLGLVKFGNFELESWNGVVAVEEGSWGSVKLLYR